MDRHSGPDHSVPQTKRGRISGEDAASIHWPTRENLFRFTAEENTRIGSLAEIILFGTVTVRSDQVNTRRRRMIADGSTSR
jgi:hypothetical protein